MVVGWNWVDDDGEPFPDPSINNGEILVSGRLTFDEQLFLSKLLDLPGVEDQKN